MTRTCRATERVTAGGVWVVALTESPSGKAADAVRTDTDKNLRGPSPFVVLVSRATGYCPPKSAPSCGVRRAGQSDPTRASEQGVERAQPHDLARLGTRGDESLCRCAKKALIGAMSSDPARGIGTFFSARWRRKNVPPGGCVRAKVASRDTTHEVPQCTNRLPSSGCRLRGRSSSQVEDWRRSQPKIPSRNEAIRQLLRRALERSSEKSEAAVAERDGAA